MTAETARGPNANVLKELLYPFEAEETGLRLPFQRRFFNGDPEAEAQTSTLAKLAPRIPLLTNSAANCGTSARVRRLDADNLFSTVIQLPQHRQVSANRCVGQTLTFESGAYRNGQKTSRALLPALAQALVTPKHRQEFLNAVVQIWHDAIAIGELANRAIGSGFPS